MLAITDGINEVEGMVSSTGLTADVYDFAREYYKSLQYGSMHAVSIAIPKPDGDCLLAVCTMLHAVPSFM